MKMFLAFVMATFFVSTAHAQWGGYGGGYGQHPHHYGRQGNGYYRQPQYYYYQPPIYHQWHYERRWWQCEGDGC